MKLNELPPKTLIKQAHAGVKLITEQYPEAAAILRETVTRFDVLCEVHQQTKKQRDDLADDTEYLKMRLKELDLTVGRLILAMRAAVIEAEHGEGAVAGIRWIFNTLLGPGEFAPEAEKNAQEYFDRELEIIDAEFSKCMDFFTSRRSKLCNGGNDAK
ncbi:hypothetical protein [Hafnia paralvei]|uniref:hypothetical protein n=1 Tax=Hafnia paralvei TaxID=546367 RepID=UPI000BB5988A|nr:hypothetical protein [Hafnia paralvei]MCE9946922.1 hypothetical protein [Hafnia paralvei]PNK69030.1 hypothetical protein A6J69_019200 [Hafnia paralvei]